MIRKLLLFSLILLTLSYQREEVTNPSVRWSIDVWEKATPIYNNIIKHPFILDLADGSLSSERFARYLVQDMAYCSTYNKQLAEFGKLLTDPKEQDFFAPYTNNDGSEAAMQKEYFERFGVLPAPPSSVTTAYNAHSQAAVDTHSKEIAIAALLPCLWVYNKVSLHIISIAKLEGNPYKEWILEYVDKDYSLWVSQLLDIIDTWAEATDQATRDKMTKVFLEAVQFEYDFWDYGYNTLHCIGNAESSSI